jgi:hypothetical protein
LFELSYNTLLEQVETIVQAATLGERLREHFARISTRPQQLVGLEELVDKTMPSLLSWSEYDHCANVTRLYSVFEVFMSEFVRDVCMALPLCMKPYSSLPSKTRRAHRVGVGKIIFEIEEKAYHRGIVQQDLVASYLHSLSDQDPYKLAPESFLVQKSALRFTRIIEILADIGFSGAATTVAGHAIIQSYIPTATNDEERRKALGKKIEEFVELRNEAAHSEVENTWRVDRLRELAYFIRDLCMVMVELGEATFIQRSLTAGILPKIGTVATIYSNGAILIIAISNCTITVGDELVLGRAETAYVGSIKSIQIDHVDYRRLKVVGETRVGVQLTINGKIGDVVYVKPENMPATPDKLGSILVHPVAKEPEGVEAADNVILVEDFDERNLDEAGEPDFDEPDEPDFDEPDEPDFDEPDEPDFDEPDEPDFDEPDEPDFDEADEPDFDEPDEPYSDGPDESATK